MYHRSSRNPPPPTLASADTAGDVQTPEHTPKIHIEDASPSVFTFPPRVLSSAYRPLSPASHSRKSSAKLVRARTSSRFSCQYIAMVAIASVLALYLLLSYHSTARADIYLNY